MDVGSSQQARPTVRAEKAGANRILQELLAELLNLQPRPRKFLLQQLQHPDPVDRIDLAGRETVINWREGTDGKDQSITKTKKAYQMIRYAERVVWTPSKLTFHTYSFHTRKPHPDG